MLVILLLFMYLGPYLPFVDRELTEVRHRFTNIEGKRLMLPPYPPIPENPLGSDSRGVDNLSKMVMGAKESVYIVLGAVALRYIIAIPLGLMAYRQRGLSNLLVNTWNNVFSFIPTIIAAGLILATPLFTEAPNRMFWGVVVIAMLEVGRSAYIIQQQAYSVSQMPFVEAGTALGLSRGRMMRSYYTPALIPEIIVNMCQDIARVMLIVGQLGVLQVFLGEIVLEPDSKYIGRMNPVNAGSNWFALLADHRQDIYFERFAFIFFPVLAIMFVIITFNVLGEGLRQHFNRKMGSYL